MNKEYGDWLSPTTGKAHLLRANITVKGDSVTYNSERAKKTICNKSVKRLKLKWRITPDEEDKCKKCLAKKKILDKKLIGDSNVVLVEERSYQGLCYGASHWFGSIHIGEVSSADLTFTLTYLQARAGNKSEGIGPNDFGRYKAGQQSNRFFTKEAFRSRAIEVAKEMFPDAKAVMIGGRWSCGPCETLTVFGNEGLRDKLNEIDNELQNNSDMDDKPWFDLMKENGLKL